MPYRNIYEKDYTSSGRTQYANFAVLVPGFVDPSKADIDDLFDINGVAEFTKQTDFVEKIGKRASNVGRAGYKPAIPAVAATILGRDTDPAIWYTDPETEVKTLVGKLLEAYTEAELKGVTAEVPTAWLAKPIKKTEASEIGVIGELQDKDYTYDIVNYSEHTTTDKYVIVTDKGNDAVPEVEGEIINHYGNQIAYELLGLGYTVLYKRLTNVEELEDDDFYEGLEDKSVYDFRYVLTGLRAGVGLTDNSTLKANNNISKLATSRNDILALVDIDENTYLNSGLTTQTQIAASITRWINQTTADEYSAIVGPGLDLYLAEDNVYKNSTLPMSLYYLACSKYALENNYKEWYAVAGYKRGVCKYVIKNPLLKVGEVLVNKLSPRTNTTYVDEVQVSKACNLVAQIRGNYYIWGNRTAFTLQADDLKAKHYLNIRQLIITIKKELYDILTSKTFNPNSDTLWFSFKSAITPLLETMVSNDGILDYDIIRTTIAQKGTMAATLRIVPIEAVEDFEITISLENSLEETNTILE